MPPHRKPAGRSALKPELLAPAGTRDAFEAAVEAGADAVYVGVGPLNARAFARNFTMADVAAMTREAHMQGRRLFVALNSLMKEDETRATVQTLAGLEKAGVDAAIIQDLGVWRIATRHFPDLRLHASTLMTIHNSAGVLQAESMGFRRVVLAREMTLREIRAVAAATSVELEVFIHGAMCFTYSGLCMFSSYHGGKSSTRGRCVQPCRRRYEWAGRKGTFFSMDDLNGLELVHDLSRAGISSLKIEGRLKPPHYVKSVVMAYRKVLDLPDDCSMQEREAAMEQAREFIAGSFGRPGSPGYFLTSAPSGAVSPTRAANTGQYMGKVVSAGSDSLVIFGKQLPADGDRLRLVDTSRDVQKAFTCKGAGPLEKQDHYTISLPPDWDAKPGNLLFRTDVASRAQKTGKISNKTSLPKNFHEGVKHKTIKVMESLEKHRRVQAGHNTERQKSGKSRRREFDVPLWLKVRSMEQLRMASDIRAAGVIMTISEPSVRAVNTRRGELFQNMEVVWALPPVIQEERLGFYRRLVTTLVRQGYRNFQAANLGHLFLLHNIRGRASRKKQPGGRTPARNTGRDIRIYGDYCLNLLNSHAVRAAGDMGISVPQIAVETDAENAEKVLAASPRPLFFTAYAWIPLFISRLDHSSYAHGRPVSSMRDEQFYWQRGNGAHVLLPHRPFSLLGRRHELEKMGFSALIIDMANWPAARKIKKKKGGRFNLMDILKRGREFNFSARLY